MMSGFCDLIMLEAAVDADVDIVQMLRETAPHCPPLLVIFARFHRSVREPGDNDLAIVERSTRMASLAVEHYRQQEALLESEERFRKLFNDVHSVPVYSCHAVVKRRSNPPEMFCIDVDLTDFKKASQRVDEQAALLEKAQDAIIVRGSWSLVHDDHGTPKSILAINTDITEFKRIKQQFHRYQRHQHQWQEPVASAIGVRHFLPKPYTAEAILKMLRTVLDERQQP